MSEYTFELNAVDRASPVVEQAMSRIREMLQVGSAQLSEALRIGVHLNPADLERMIGQLNALGDRAVTQMREVGVEIGESLQNGMLPSDALGARMNTILRETLTEARAQILEFTQTTRIFPGSERAGEVAEFAEQFQQTMLRSIQVVAEQLRAELNAAARSVGLDPRAVTGQFQGTRIASAAGTQLRTQLTTPLTTEEFRDQVDSGRAQQAEESVRVGQERVSQSEHELELELAIAKAIDEQVLTQRELLRLQEAGYAFPIRNPTSTGLIPPGTPTGVAIPGYPPRAYNLDREGTAAPFDPEVQALQYQRQLDNAVAVRQRQTDAVEQETAAEIELAARNRNLAALLSDPAATPVGTAYRSGSGAYFERTGAEITGSDPATQLRIRDLDAKYLAAEQRRTAAAERDAQAVEEQAAADQRRANLARLAVDPNLQRVGTAFRSGQGDFFERTGAAVDPSDPAGAVRIRELNTQYAAILAKRNSTAELQLLSQQQQDRGLGGAFLGGATGRGFDAHASFDPQAALGNIAGTFGVLARYGAAGIAIQAAFKAFAEVKDDVIAYDTSLAHLNEMLDAVHGSQVNVNDAISAAAPAGISAVQAIDLASEALARYRDEVEQGANADLIVSNTLQTVAQMKVLTGQTAQDTAQQLMDASQGFGLGSGGQSRIADAIENARKNFGGDRAQIATAIGDAGDLAAQAGISPEELSNIVGLIQARTGGTGQTIASAFERTVSRQGTSTFRQALGALDIQDTGNLTSEITQLSAAWNGLTQTQQDSLIASLGGARQAKELLPLLQDGKDLVDANRRSYEGAGAATDQYTRLQATLAGEIRQMGGAFHDMAAQFTQSGLFTFLGPLLIGVKDAVQGVDELFRVFNALPTPIREVGATLLEALVVLRLLGSESQRMAVGGALERVPVLGAFSRRIGLTPSTAAAGGAGAAGSEFTTQVTSAGVAFSQEIVSAATEAAAALRGESVVGGAAAGGAVAGGAEAAAAEMSATAALLAARAEQLAQGFLEAGAEAGAGIEGMTAEEIEARAAGIASLTAALVEGGEEFNVAFAAVTAAFEAEAVDLEAAAAAVGLATEEFAAVVNAATVARAVTEGGPVGGVGPIPVAGAGGFGAMLTNPMTIAIVGLIAIGGIANSMHQLDAASKQATQALDDMGKAKTSEQFTTVADQLVAARQQLAKSSGGFFGSIAGFLDNTHGQEAELSRQIAYARSTARGLTSEEGNRSQLANSAFGPTGSDVATGLQNMAQSGIDATTQLQAVAEALGLVGRNAGTASSDLAAGVHGPQGLRNTVSTVAALAGFAASAANPTGEVSLEDLPKNDPRRNAKVTSDAVTTVFSPDQADVSKAITRALGNAPKGSVITEDDRQKIATAIANSYNITGPGADADRQKIRAEVLKHLDTMNMQALRGATGPVTDDELNNILNGDGKNNPGLLALVQSAKADPFDPTGGGGAGGPLSNAVAVLRSYVERADKSGSHYAELLQAFHQAEDNLAQAQIANLEKLRQAADAQAGSPAAQAHIDTQFYTREIIAARGNTNRVIDVINNLTDGQVRIVQDALEERRLTAQAALLAAERVAAHIPPDERGAVLNHAEEVYSEANQAYLNFLNAKGKYRVGPQGAGGGGLTQPQQEQLAAIQAGGVAGDPVSQAQTQLAAAEFQLHHARHGSVDYYNAQKAVNDAKFQLAQSESSLASAQAGANVYPGSQLDQARVQIVQAKDALGAAVQGTEAWFSAKAQLEQAQIAYGNALIQYHATERSLHGDITDPVFQARNILITARQQLRADRRRGAPQDVLATDQLAEEQASNQAQAARFNQRFQDVQTLHDLGQMSDRAYIAYLDHQHDRLQAIHHRTRQQYDELLQIDQALKAAGDQMQGQWNIGDIKIPTPYEARRYIQAQSQGVGYQSLATTHNTTTITHNHNEHFNFAGLSKHEVLRILQQELRRALGDDVQHRRGTATRKG